jgi:hypothetical protein
MQGLFVWLKLRSQNMPELLRKTKPSIRRRGMGDRPGERLLPPREWWLVDAGEKLPTPTDARGFVDIPATIRTVKQALRPGYKWAKPLSVHHFQHPDEAYKQASPTANTFHELPVNKGLVPREFENFLHTITLEPPMPDKDAMHHYNEAWNVAHDLFASMSQAISWERKRRRREELLERRPDILPADFNGEDVIGQEVLAGILDHHFVGIEQHLERAHNIPLEFRLFDPEQSPEALAPHLGSLVVPPAMCWVKIAAA